MPKAKPITTNDIQPQPARYPAPNERKPASGPMITTHNIEEIRKQNRAKPKKG